MEIQAATVMEVFFFLVLILCKHKFNYIPCLFYHLHVDQRMAVFFCDIPPSLASSILLTHQLVIGQLSLALYE